METWSVDVAPLVMGGQVVKGPAASDGSRGPLGYVYLRDERGNCLLDTRALDVWPLTAKARAAIEAIPPLLAACKRALAEIAADNRGGGEGYGTMDTEELLRAALAAARTD